MELGGAIAAGSAGLGATITLVAGIESIRTLTVHGHVGARVRSSPQVTHLTRRPAR